MGIALQKLATDTYVPMLENLSSILDKASAYSAASQVALVHAKLAPDMYDLAQQIQESCYYAVDGVARLAGRSEATREAVEETLEGLKGQIRKALEFVRGVPSAAFEGAENRDYSMPMDEKMVIQMDAERYLLGWSLPLFYFHVVTAYDILRHSGVELSVQDYAAQVGGFIRPKAD